MSKLEVFYYGKNMGGIGDFLKSLKMYIVYSVKKNNKIYIHITNTTIKKFIIIKDKYKFNPEIKSVKFMKTSDIVRNKKLNKNEEKCDIILFDYINFNDILYKRFELVMKQKNIKFYNCIHIRIGDKFGNKSFPCKSDDRCKNKNIDSIVNSIVINNNNLPLILVSDNLETKKYISDKYKLIVFDTKITHLDSQYSKNIDNTESDIINNFVEYLILCKANTIHSIGRSGFSYTASWFYNNKIIFY